MLCSELGIIPLKKEAAEKDLLLAKVQIRRSSAYALHWLSSEAASKVCLHFIQFWIPDSSWHDSEIAKCVLSPLIVLSIEFNGYNFSKMGTFLNSKLITKINEQIMKLILCSSDQKSWLYCIGLIWLPWQIMVTAETAFKSPYLKERKCIWIQLLLFLSQIQLRLEEFHWAKSLLLLIKHLSEVNILQKPLCRRVT